MARFDQAQSPRLGQRTAVESTYVRMFDGTDIPEAAWVGQMIYRTDRHVLQVYTEADAWEDVLGGVGNVLTFVGPSIPVSVHAADVWYDSDDHYKLYVARSAGADSITAGEWELAQDSYSAAQAAAAAQNAADLANFNLGNLDNLVTPDGLPPASSPTPVAVGGINSLSVRWTAVNNHDPVLYEVHISSSGPTFTPSNATRQVITSATSYTITEKLADGTMLVKDGSLIYYVRLIAKDADGSAAPSTAGSAALRQIADADISANYVYTNYLNALQITGSVLNADLAIVGKLKTADSGQRVEITSDGLKQYAPDGVTVRVDLPNDPTKNPYLDGTLVADGLTLKSGLELRGTDNIFAMGSKITLQTQTVASATAPSMTIDYPLSGAAFAQWLRPVTGFWMNSSESVTRFTTSFFGAVVMWKDTAFFTRPTIIRNDGAPVPDYAITDSTAISVGGNDRVVTLASYAVGSDAWYADKFMITTWDDSTMLSDGSDDPVKKAEIQDGIFTFEWEWMLGRCFSSSGAARANQFCQVKRSTINPWPGGDLQFKVYSATDSAISTVITRTLSNDGFLAQDERIVGVNYGSSARMGFSGTDEDIWVIHGTANNYVYKDGTTLTRQTFREFPAQASNRRVMAGGDLSTNSFTAFYVAPENNGALLYKYTNLTWDASTTSSIWWGAFTWYDSVGTTHETSYSARTQITMKQRARLNVTVPELPDPAGGKGTTRAADDVNSFRFYLARGSTEPARTSFQQQTAPSDLAQQISYTSVSFTVTTSPPLTTNFPDQAAALFESNALGTGSFPKIQLTGDGFAHLEALDVGGAGAVSLTGKAFEQLYYSIRAQSQLTAGGVKNVDGSFNISWTSRFMTVTNGRSSNLATDGYFEITMPVNGTVIPGHGGASSQTVTSGKVLLNAWTSLWYELPYGSALTSLTGNFHLVSYTSDFTVPNNWVMIALRNNDDAVVEWATGETVLAASAAGEDTSSSVLTAATGWDITNQTFRRSGRTVMCTVTGSRTGAALTIGANGDIVNSVLANFADTTWNPLVTAHLSSGGTGQTLSGVFTGSQLIMTAIAGSSMGTGGTWSLGGTYLT